MKFQDDIPEELKIGGIYTLEQIELCIKDNDIYITDNEVSYHANKKEIKYRVDEIIKGIINQKQSHQNILTFKSAIYKITEIK